MTSPSELPPEYLLLASRLREVDVKLSNEIYSVFEGLGEAKCELEQKIVDLNQQIQALTKRLDNLDTQNQEAIEQAIAYAAYENGLDHL